MNRTLVLALAAAVSATGCGNDTATGPGDVTGALWRLDSLVEGGNPPILSGGRSETFTIRFTENGRLEVRADCNTCSGAYQLFGRALTVGPLACTRAFCPSAPLDFHFVRLVEAAKSAEISGDTLILRSEAGVIYLTP